jgi:hypothetical protein
MERIMKIRDIRVSELFGAEVLIGVFGPLFLVFAFLTTLEDSGTIELFWMSVATFLCGCLCLGGIASWFIGLHCGLDSNYPGPRRGLPISDQTTPCDARGRIVLQTKRARSN